MSHESVKAQPKDLRNLNLEFQDLSSDKRESLEKVDTLSEQTKLNLLGFLLILMLGLVAITTARTFQAVDNFQQQCSKVEAGDVSTVRPWMTVRVISHVYHVPENYLYRSLTVGNPARLRHATLYVIAAHRRQPVDQVIYTAQRAILMYRKRHSSFASQDQSPPTNRESTLSRPGRISY
jgi:hypothetical protein